MRIWRWEDLKSAMGRSTFKELKYHLSHHRHCRIIIYRLMERPCWWYSCSNSSSRALICACCVSKSLFRRSRSWISYVCINVSIWAIAACLVRPYLLLPLTESILLRLDLLRKHLSQGLFLLSMLWIFVLFNPTESCCSTFCLRHGNGTYRLTWARQTCE